MKHEVDGEAPVDVLWAFPIQPGLSEPIVLMLQDDELHFGVGSLQAGFYPFPKVAEAFAALLDDWVAGSVRLAPMRRGAKLQRFGDGEWRTLYSGTDLTGSRRQIEIVQNIRDA